jgi:predicted transcriptional regulator
MTVMLRLSEKKVLQREKVGSHYEYWLTSSQDQVPTFFEQLKQRVFGIKTTELISYLLDSSEEITEEELAEVQKLLTKAQAKIKKKQS